MWANESLLFLDVLRPPELLQFVDEVIPILHSERTFASHHDSHGDVIISTIDIRVPESVTQIERLASFSLLKVIANLGGTLHVQNERLPLISFNQLGEDLLAIAFASQFLTHGCK